jgi:hypothetical protein
VLEGEYPPIPFAKFENWVPIYELLDHSVSEALAFLKLGTLKTPPANTTPTLVTYNLENW